MSNYYDQEDKVSNYIEMSKDCVGDVLIEKLAEYLEDKKTVLELGSGPGNDFGVLKSRFDVTGSDRSKIFVDLLKELYPKDNIIQLDAIKMDIESKFDAIYSNKVMQHLTKQEVAESLKNQVEILQNKGIVLHSFWYGDSQETYDGLRFVYYTEAQLKELFQVNFEIVEINRYKEEEKDDSIYIIAKAK